LTAFICPIVVLHYIGDGKRGTGDWCFQDGFITFADLAALYLKLLRGRVLTIVSDCSHSGSWVRECMNFLDQQGVGPCGHKARDKGILLKIFTSCLSHQIPRQLAHLVRGFKNEKNTNNLGFIETLPFISPKSELCDAQHANTKDFTEVLCRRRGKDINQECLCLPEASWKKWNARQRTFTYRSRQDGRKAWHILLFQDSDKTVLDYLTCATIPSSDHCEELRSGWGEEPTKEEAEHAKEAVYKENLDD
jgi:hypothetical protein